MDKVDKLDHNLHKDKVKSEKVTNTNAKDTSEDKVRTKEIESYVDNFSEDKDALNFNFIINASNQAGVAQACNVSQHQVNGIFILVSPYRMEDFYMEDLDIRIKIDGEGTIFVNEKEFMAMEIQPGIKVFGLTKHTNA